MEPGKVLMTLPPVSFYPSESEDVTQLANDNGGCKLHITFFVQARKFVIFLINFKTKLIYFLNSLNQVSIFDWTSFLDFH